MATPEALDSLQLRRPQSLENTRAIIVDEIHLLHGSPRGQQLRHVIDRIQQTLNEPKSKRDKFQIVGMTATLDDVQEVGRIWLGDGGIVYQHGNSREINSEFTRLRIGENQDPKHAQAQALAQWIKQGRADKVLVFANSRNAAHVFATNLLEELQGERWPVHLHYGVLAKSERERVEEEMRKNRFGVCVATATLEIGIDIGDVDAIVLADPPSTVSAFLQGIGRGNRRNDSCRVIAFPTSENEEMLYRARRPSWMSVPLTLPPRTSLKSSGLTGPRSLSNRAPSPNQRLAALCPKSRPA